MIWNTPKMRNRVPRFTASVYAIAFGGIVGFVIALIHELR